MDFFVKTSVVATAVFAFGYLCYVMIRPERF